VIMTSPLLWHSARCGYWHGVKTPLTVDDLFGCMAVAERKSLLPPKKSKYM
jgi:hypothetical protein